MMRCHCLPISMALLLSFDASARAIRSLGLRSRGWRLGLWLTIIGMIHRFDFRTPTCAIESGA
jgi:hypothetical protein